MERACSPCSYFVLNVPGALPRAGMNRAFGAPIRPSHLLAPSPGGRRPDSYRPGATRQVQERQYPGGRKARFIPAWRNAPGTGAAIPLRAGGPIHTSLAQHARFRSGNTPEGRRPDSYQPGATRQVQERQYPGGPEARFIPAWRNAPGSGADTPEGRRPDSYQPGATRQVQERQFPGGLKARFIPAWRNAPGTGADTPEGRRPDSYRPGATRQVQERQYPRGLKARFIPAWRNAPGAGSATPPRAGGPIHTSLAQPARCSSDK